MTRENLIRYSVLSYKFKQPNFISWNLCKWKDFAEQCSVTICSLELGCLVGQWLDSQAAFLKRREKILSGTNEWSSFRDFDQKKTNDDVWAKAAPKKNSDLMIGTCKLASPGPGAQATMQLEIPHSSSKTQTFFSLLITEKF